MLAENSTICECNQLLQKQLLEKSSKKKLGIITKKTSLFLTKCYKRRKIACTNTKRHAYLAIRCVHKSVRKVSITRKNRQRHTNVLTNATTYIKNASKWYVPDCKLKAVSVATESSKSVELSPTSKSHY